MTGSVACAGIAAGIAKVRAEYAPALLPCTNPSEEIEKIDGVLKELSNKLEESISELDSESAEIIRTDLLLLSDESYLNRVKHIIEEQNITAAGAAYLAGKYYAEQLASLGDAVIQARSEDMLGWSVRLSKALDQAGTSESYSENTIIVAESISPEELFSVDLSRVNGFITVSGSPISHTAIIARKYGIPYIYNADISGITDGDLITMDTTGEIRINPEWDLYEQTMEIMLKAGEERFGKTCQIDTRTKICANIDGAADLELLRNLNVDGVGLFRTESLLMNRDALPDEEEQYEIYKAVIEAMAGKPVWIRAFDVGAEKTVKCIDFPKEKNPALGYRGVRVLLQYPELLKSQLRGILRASDGNTGVMFPMITSVQELIRLRAALTDAEADLEAVGCEYKPVKLGVMIETPAAVLIADQLAEYADFFSIGTNDLTQYTLALDRETGGLEEYYLPHHEGIFRQIQMVVEHAHQNGVPVSVCGELVSDSSAIKRLVELKVDALSTAGSMVNSLRGWVGEAEHGR